jgi:hypothetical protein
MRKRFYFFMLIACITAGCSHEQKKPADVANTPKTPAVMDPFKFHKAIEVSPGQTFDVLSWGRGATNTGAFLILHSDSSGKKYTTTTGDLDGTITDVYNADMDMDGNPEILIQAKGKDSTNYTNIYAFEFKDNKAQKLDFPRLSTSQRKGYRGGDNFYIEEGKFIREYPIYEGSGSEAKPTGKKMKLEYGLSSNSFTVKQLSKDSTVKTVKAISQPTSTAKKTDKKDKPAEKHTKKAKKPEKKHHKTEKHKKKKHHKKHHSDDDNDDSDSGN